jgi:hypothetical protein
MIFFFVVPLMYVMTVYEKSFDFFKILQSLFLCVICLVSVDDERTGCKIKGEGAVEPGNVENAEN